MAYRRLSKLELAALGFAQSSKRYITDEVNNILGAGKDFLDYVKQNLTISNRQYATRQLQERTGAPSKEQFTKRAKLGQARYISPKQETAIKTRTRFRSIRNALPSVTPKDIRIIDKFREQGFKSLTQSEMKSWDTFFKKYPRQEVFEAIGSPIVQGRRAA